MNRAALRDRDSRDWLLALALAAAVTLVRALWLMFVPAMPLLVYLPAVGVVSLAGGWQAGTVFLGGTMAGATLFWAPPFWAPPGVADQPAWVLLRFSVVAVLVIAVSHGIRRLLRQSRAQRTQLEVLSREQGALMRQQAVNFGEMQHRIANNLQYVSNMLAVSQIEIDRGVDPHEVLERAMARLEAMSQLHRKLHDIATYRHGVGEVLQATLAEILDPARVEVALHLEPAPMSLDQMTALVLFVTEAATNADKHVFRQGQGSRFEVRLCRVAEGRLRLCVRDDGPGMRPASAPATGLGLRIMNGLAGQLGGVLHTDDSAGHAVSVEFSPA